jgi:hypothetical protein
MNNTSRYFRNSDYRDICSASPCARIGQGRQNTSHCSGRATRGKYIYRHILKCC